MKFAPRELEVIQSVAQGRPNKSIGNALGLSEGTIKEYINRIFKKTGASNRTELAVAYLQGKYNETSN